MEQDKPVVLDALAKTDDVNGDAYRELDRRLEFISDPANLARVFGGREVEALVVQFKDKSGKVRSSLTAAGSLAFMAKRGSFHVPPVDLKVIDMWVEIGGKQVSKKYWLALATATDKVRDNTFSAHSTWYAKDEYSPRAAETSALGRVARLHFAGDVQMLEQFCNDAVEQGQAILPGDIPDSMLKAVETVDAAEADERLEGTEPWGKLSQNDFVRRVGDAEREAGKEPGWLLDQAKDRMRRMWPKLPAHQIPKDEADEKLEGWLVEMRGKLDLDDGEGDAPTPSADGPSADDRAEIECAEFFDATDWPQEVTGKLIEDHPDPVERLAAAKEQWAQEQPAGSEAGHDA